MIRVFEPNLTWKDKISVLKDLNKNNISGQSPSVKQFENACASRFDRNFGVAVSNGSVALDLAFQSLDLSPDDEVILPSFTIISCLAAVIRSGAKPIFCDVDELSWNMTLRDVKKVYTKNTKVVLMVHTYGLTADAENINEFCEEKNLILIEDAAEAHGQNVNNNKCGSFGMISTLSFYANKHVTTGEGGMILTNSDHLYKKLQQMRNLDFSSKRFQHDNFYWNYRLSGIQASLGLSQLNSLDEIIKFKIKQGSNYLKLFKSLEDLVQVPQKEIGNTKNHFWVFGIVLKQNIDRSKIVKHLTDKGIETRPFFWPLHLQNALNINKKLKLNISENLGKNGFYLPMGKHVSYSKQEMIVSEISNALKK